MRQYHSMTLPELATVLKTLAVRLRCNDLTQIAVAMKRRRPSVPAKPSSRKATDELRAQIPAFAYANIGLSQLEIAYRFGVNPGRVSEALHGKRGEK